MAMSLQGMNCSEMTCTCWCFKYFATLWPQYKHTPEILKCLSNKKIRNRDNSRIIFKLRLIKSLKLAKKWPKFAKFGFVKAS